MSTEEAELTFIRCPSCRSLVPAVASRCRMCGHNFSEAKSSVAQQENQASQTIIPTIVPREQQLLSEQSDVAPESPAHFSSDQGQKEESPTRITNFLAEQELREKVSQVDAVEKIIPEVLTDDTEFMRRRRRKKRKRRPDQLVEHSIGQIIDNPTRSENDMDNYSTETRTPVINNPVVNRNGAIQFGESTKVGREGVLVGWFVSYGVNQSGASQEIRSGQFFIGRQRLRDNDLLIQDDSVSTPHLLIRAADQGGFLVQDLLSEEGTYIKRAGQSEFTRCEEPTKVSHGDTLRIGRYETLVCLLPKS